MTDGTDAALVSAPSRPVPWRNVGACVLLVGAALALPSVANGYVECDGLACHSIFGKRHASGDQRGARYHPA